MKPGERDFATSQNVCTHGTCEIRELRHVQWEVLKTMRQLAEFHACVADNAIVELSCF